MAGSRTTRCESFLKMRRLNVRRILEMKPLGVCWPVTSPISG